MAPPGELRVNADVVWLAGNTVWSTPERIRGEVLTTMRYTNRHLRLRLQLLWTCVGTTQCWSCCERVLERHSAGAIVCCGRCLHEGWWNDTVVELLWTCRVRRQCVLWQTTPSTARQRQLVINWHDVSPLNLDLIRFVTSTVYSYIYLYIFPPSVRNASSLMSFRRNLKTVMFWSFFSD